MTIASHRRRRTLLEQIIDTARFSVGVATLPLFRCAKLISSHDYRAIGLLVSAMAWTGVVLSHLFGMHDAMAIFASMIDALTWGQAAATFVPTEDGFEFSVLSGATSIAVLILVGMLLVELRLTGAFVGAFIGVGAVSLLLQLGSYRQRSNSAVWPMSNASENEAGEHS
jgi:hypothetical protein